MRKPRGVMIGEDHPHAKLTEALVLQLRRRARRQKDARGWMQDVADARGVSLVAILYAIGGETWSHLDHIERPVKPGHRYLS